MQDPIKIPLQPLYSLPCPTYRQMTLTAKDLVSDDPEGEKKYKFNPETLQFTSAPCDCCLNHYEVDEFKFRGTQGFQYQRSHRDEEGNLLICVGIHWNVEGPSNMNLFIGPNGHVAEYQWNIEKEVFKMKESLGVELTVPLNQSDKAILMDSEVIPMSMRFCVDHGAVMQAKSKTPRDQRDLKLIWNSSRCQFESIKCECVTMRQDVSVIGDRTVLMMTVFDSKNQTIWIVKNQEKLSKVYFIGKAHLRPSPIRDLGDHEFLYPREEIDIVQNSHVQPTKTYGTWALFYRFLVDETGTIWKIQERPDVNHVNLKGPEAHPLPPVQINPMVKIDKDILELEFLEFQEKLGEPKAKSPEIKWEDFDVPSDDDTIQEASDEENDVDSDVDYDAAEAVKPMAPESVITRDNDSYSMLSEMD